MEKVLLRNVEIPDSHTLAVYKSRGGYRALEKVFREMSPEKLLDDISLNTLSNDDSL